MTGNPPLVPVPVSTGTRPARRVTGLRRWHRWCGLSILVFLLVAAVSGSVLVYKKELIRLLITPQATLPAGYDTGSMAIQLDAILATTAATGPNPPFIKAPSHEEPYWTLSSAENTVLLSLDTLQPHRRNLWLLDALAFVRELHTELLTGLVGEALLLASGVGALFLSISGLMIWWPTRKSFRWRWVLPRAMPLHFLVHAHRHTGAVTALVLILVTLTGSIMLWQKLVKPILPADIPAPLPLSFEVSAATTPSQWLLAASKAVPDGWPTYIRLPGADRSDGSVRLRLPGEWHPNGRTTMAFDHATGSATLSLRSDQAPPARMILNQLYPLHSGYGVGWLYAALVFASGIAMLWLGTTGVLSYWRRRA